MEKPIKTAKTQRVEAEAKIGQIRKRLAEMRDYKRLIEADGLAPDAEDKRLETELIRRLLYLEKQINGRRDGKKAKPSQSVVKKETGKSPVPRQRRAKESSARAKSSGKKGKSSAQKSKAP